MKLSKYFELVKPQYVYIEIIPHKSNRNYNSANIAKAISKTYRTINKRISKEKKKIFFHTNFKISYMIDITSNDVHFYFIIPTCFQNIIVEKIKETWNKSTINIVDKPKPISDNAEIYQLSYKKEDALSLNVDKKSNEPLTSILNVMDIMKDDDRLSIVYNFIPGPQLGWINRYTETIEKIKNHKVIDKRQHSFEYYSKITLSFLCEFFDGIMNIINDFTGFKKEDEKESIYKALLGMIEEQKELSLSTKRKKEATVINTQIAVISSSSDKVRKTNNAIAVNQAYRVLDEDNELLYSKTNFNTLDLEKYDFNIDTNTFSTDETTNFIQLPGRLLLNQFKINHVKVEESELPAELKKGYVNLGVNTYKGLKCNAYLEDEYNIGNLCQVCIGGQGSGKTTYIENVAKNCIDNNECVIVLDFIKNCEMSQKVKAITPKDRLVEIDLASEEDIQGLGYNEIVIEKNMTPFKKLDLAFKQSDQLMNLIDAVSLGEPLSPSMRRFFSAAAIVVMVQGYNSLKNVVECLESHIKRQQYINSLDASLKEKLEEELNTLSELDEYNKKGELCSTKFNKIQFIIDRVYLLRSDFKLKYMYNKSLKGNINLKKCMDERKVVLIKMKENDFPSKMVKNILITYWISKIWLSTQIRGSENEKPSRVNTFIDELFQAPTSLNMLNYILPQTRKFGTKFILSTHYIKQLETIFESLMTANSSFMLLRGCTENDFNHFKSKLNNFEYEDLRDMEEFSSLNIIYYTKGYSTFITKLPKPIK